MSASPVVVESAPSTRTEVVMPLNAPLKRAAELGLKLAAALSFLAPLLTRLVVGQAFFLTGRGKWQNFENTVTFFTELGIPFPEANAAFVSSLELVGGICLVLGLLTRLMSAGLLSTMVVALATADKERFFESLNPAAEIGPLDVSPVVFLLLLLWLTLFGPGLLSLDALLKQWLGLGKKASAEGGIAG
jgi:putative oxidoreductase